MSENRYGGVILSSAECSEILKLVGMRIRQLREESGFSRQKLAENSGVSEQCIAYLEHGEREPRVLTLLKIALVLSCSTDYLLRGDLLCADFAVFFSRMGKIDPDRIGELYNDLKQYTKES